MTKGKIITLSILLFVITLLGILFGVVFCLRQQDVTVVGDSPVTVSREEIITTAGFENGKSIFMLDKDAATNKIEQKYPYVKVVQIKTTGVTKIDIRIRARHEMFYTKFGENYYVMDEDLKVLKIIDNGVEPVGLTAIKENCLNINASTLICDFIGDEFQTNSINNLFEAVYSTVKKDDNNYLTRQEISALIKNVELKTYNTFNKIIITTSYGVKLDIENPERDMNNKIYFCFEKIKEYINDANGKETSGVIKLFYDLEDTLKFAYIEE